MPEDTCMWLFSGEGKEVSPSVKWLNLGMSTSHSGAMVTSMWQGPLPVCGLYLIASEHGSGKFQTPHLTLRKKSSPSIWME